MFDAIATMFSFGFIIRAFIVGIIVSLCASLLGVTLVLKKYSMIGDGLSHVGFGAMTVALALNAAPLYVAIPVMFIAAYLLLRLRESSRVNSDAAIAMISSTSIAIGITAASLSGGMNTDVYGYMFGSILAVSGSDVITAAILGAVVVAVFVLCYNRIFALTFDEGFASSSGIRCGTYNTILAFMTAATVILGMRVMGTMLISGLIIFPAVTGMKLFKSFKGVTVCAAAVSVLSFIVGMFLSYAFAYIPAGAGVVLANGAFFVIASIIGKRQ